MMMNTVVGLNQSTQVMKKKTLSVGDSYEVSVGGSDDGSKITLDGQSITLGSQRIELTADREILLRCGQSTIRLTPGRSRSSRPMSISTVERRADVLSRLFPRKDG
ncbi:hypothetical protein P4234_13720 [Pseudomonas aeruginosa]|nr:hypothetical protein [Pseudomonas aeruginosa]